MSRTSIVLVAIGALHLLGLAAYYFTFPFIHYLDGGSPYEELFSADFLIFPGVLVATWALISVLVLLRYRTAGRAGMEGTLRALSIGICIVLAAFAWGLSGLVPPELDTFHPYGADEPAPAPLAFVLDDGGVWWLIPALGAVLAAVVIAARRTSVARVAFDGQIALLAVANASLITTLVGTVFLPMYGCGGNGDWYLHVITHLRGADTMQRLVVWGARFDQASRNVALLVAVAGPRPATVQVLLDGGANVNAAGERGATPLHVAAIQGHEDIAAVLLASGAQVNAGDAWGQTPLDYADQSKRARVAGVLAAHGGIRSTEETRQRGRTSTAQIAKPRSARGCG